MTNSQSESFIDIVTTAFQSTVAVTAVFGIGYLYNGKMNRHNLGTTLPWVARYILGPALILTTLASSDLITIKSIWRLWPIPVLALITHILSLTVGVLLHRVGGAPGWIIESLTCNNVTSIPLLTWYFHSRITSLKLSSSANSAPYTGILSHLKWRILDKVEDVELRGYTYIVVSLVVVQIARSFLFFLTKKMKPTDPTGKIALEVEDALVTNGDVEHARAASVDGADEDRTNGIDNDEGNPTETTPLIRRYSSTTPSLPLWKSIFIHTSPIILPGLLGLVIAVIPPVKKALAGEGSWVWQVLGLGLGTVGGTWAVVDLLGNGGNVRQGENKASDKIVPPTLGYVILISVWRYFALPAISIAIVYGFRERLSLKAFLHDPAFAYVLATTVVSPPSLPESFTAHRASVHLTATLLYFLSSISLAYAVAASGRGVSFKSDFDIKYALKSAFGGGIAGALAMILQVLALMWIRTAMNYQYRYGGKFLETMKKLYAEGGIPRFYAGLAAALVQAPVSRFGDTAANAGIFALLESLTWPVLVKTVAASVASALFRMTLTPIDTLKTTQQTRGGVEGLKLLKDRIREFGIGCLWWGAFGTAGATFVGHYPWFGTYNFLQAHLPPSHNIVQKLLRQAFIGFAASVVSDTVSNSLRVVKTYRQVHETSVGYFEVAKKIVQEEGWRGLFGRGLITRYVANGLQGILFSVLWKLFSDLIARKGK